MKKELVVGFIGAIVMTIIATVIVVSGAKIGAYIYLSLYEPPTIETIALNQIVANIIWGTIFGILYSRFYKSIPGKGIWKGLVYGLMIFFFSNMYMISYALVYGDPIMITGYLIFVAGIYVFIGYGLVLGYLYEKVIIK